MQVSAGKNMSDQEPGKKGRPDQETRDDNGRYHTGMDAMCRCGHKLGWHLGAGRVSERACIAHECDGGPEKTCGCEGFRKKR